MNLNERIADLVVYRMQNSKEKLGSAKILLENGKLKDSISRSYYRPNELCRLMDNNQYLQWQDK